MSDPSADPMTIGQIVLAGTAIATFVASIATVLGRKKIQVAPDPLTVKPADAFATKDELKVQTDRITKLEDQIRTDNRATHERIDKLTSVVGEVNGKMDVLLKLSSKNESNH